MTHTQLSAIEARLRAAAPGTELIGAEFYSAVNAFLKGSYTDIAALIAALKKRDAEIARLQDALRSLVTPSARFIDDVRGKAVRVLNDSMKIKLTLEHVTEPE